MRLEDILLIIAIVCFAFAAFRGTRRMRDVQLTPLGLAFTASALLIYFGGV